MLNDFVEYLRGLPYKEWGGSIAGAIIALAGVVYTQRAKARMTHEQRIIDNAKAVRDGDRSFDIVATQDLTARFKALMDGYEARIVDLTNELRANKVELREARDEITKLRERLDAG